MLVHGAFADASSWTGVIERLQAQGVPVVAPANPLRGISDDSAYIASVLEQIAGPVLAVGHSYGGAVITNAAAADNVVGLVYVAAFAPDEARRSARSTAHLEGQRSSARALVPHQYPTAAARRVEFAIDPAKFLDAFAADLPAEQTAVMAATQRPVADSAFAEPTAPRRGSGCRPGRSWRPATRRPAPTSCARWPSGRGRRSPRSTPRT